MSEDHFIYVIAVANPGQMPGPVKIGITNNVVARFKTLQTACPYPITLIHSFRVPDKDIARGIEQAFHKVQKKHRTSGEWFAIDPGIALIAMCLNIEAMLRFHLELDEAEIPASLEFCGVTAATAKIRAATGGHA